MTISWAVHRLDGISSPANAAYSPSELAFQLQNSRSNCLFTCEALLPVALQAAKIVNLPRSRIFLCPVAGKESTTRRKAEFSSLDELISEGAGLSILKEQTWTIGQSKRQVAFICYSSGTSGLPVSEPHTWSLYIC